MAENSKADGVRVLDGEKMLGGETESRHFTVPKSPSIPPPPLQLTAEKNQEGFQPGSAFNQPLQLETGGGDPTKVPKMADRHLWSRQNFFKGAEAGNSYLLNDISKDALQKLYDEALTKGIKDGNVTLKNGQQWYLRQSDGKFYPVKGPGILNLTKQEVSFLRTAVNQIKGGKSAEQALLNMKLALKGQGYTMSGSFQAALQRFATMRGLNANFVVKNFAQFGASAKNVPPDLVKAAQKKFPNKSLKYVRYGGRILIVVAIAADIYNIYNSENKAKTIATTAGGWAGAAAGAYGGGAAGAWIGGWGAIPGALIGGAIGYFAGEEITETIYEWIFEEI